MVQYNGSLKARKTDGNRCRMDKLERQRVCMKPRHCCLLCVCRACPRGKSVLTHHITRVVVPHRGDRYASILFPPGSCIEGLVSSRRVRSRDDVTCDRLRQRSPDNRHKNRRLPEREQQAGRAGFGMCYIHNFNRASFSSICCIAIDEADPPPLDHLPFTAVSSCAVTCLSWRVYVGRVVQEVV